MSFAPPELSLSPAFDVVVTLGPIEDHGDTRVGHRRIVPISGGSVTGALLSGEILPGGADWQIVRADGAIEVDGRYTVQDADGGFAYLRVAGVRSGSPEVLESLLAGEVVSPDQYYFRTVVTIESASHRELEHAIFVASCVRDADTVRYRAYRLN